MPTKEATLGLSVLCEEGGGGGAEGGEEAEEEEEEEEVAATTMGERPSLEPEEDLRRRGEMG